MTRRALRVLAAALIGAAASLAVPGVAHAAACPAGTGVTVVVNQGVRCDADGGGRASGNFADAGHRLTYASRSAGFVCRVDGAPVDDPCVEASPADAYWALFWSDGTSGDWVYSSLGVGSLRVPQGGSVAFVFQNSGSKKFPSVSPPVAATSTPDASAPSDSGSKKSDETRPRRERKKPGAPKATQPGVGGTTAAPTAPSAAPSASASAPTPATPEPSGTVRTPAASADASSAAEPVEQMTPAAASGESDGGTAVVAAAAGVGLLVAAAGFVAWRRRRSA